MVERSVLSIACALIVSAGCTNVLGIDGDYSLAPDALDGSGGLLPAASAGANSAGGLSGSARAATGGDAPGEGGSGGTLGPSVDSGTTVAIHGDGGKPGGAGGTTSNGGSISFAAGGAQTMNDGGAPASGAAGTGGETSSPPDAGGENDVCLAMHWLGSLEGKHIVDQLQPLSDLELTVSGTTDILLEPTGANTLVVTQGSSVGTMTGNLGVVPFELNFTTEITGTFDCTTRVFDGAIAGGTDGLPVQAFNFQGTQSGTLDATTRTVSGEWKESSGPGSRGSGTWSAAAQ